MTALETAVIALKRIAQYDEANKNGKNWGPGNANWCRDQAKNALKLVANAKRREKRAVALERKRNPDPVGSAWYEWRRHNLEDHVYHMTSQKKLIAALRRKYEED